MQLQLPEQRTSWTPYTNPGSNENPNAGDSAFEPGPQPSVPDVNGSATEPPPDTTGSSLDKSFAATCLIGIPKIETPGPLPAIPEICLFKKSYGYAILGFVVMSAGVFIMAAGVFVLVKTDRTVLQAAGIANPATRFSGNSSSIKVDRSSMRADRRNRNRQVAADVKGRRWMPESENNDD